MTKSLVATGATLVTALGAVLTGVNSMATSNAAVCEARPTASPATAPLNPAADVPTVDQLSSILDGLAAPDIPSRSKGDLVEGGIGTAEGIVVDRVLRTAYQNDQLPSSFSVSNIQPAGPGEATADVAACGAESAPTALDVTFVDDGGWKLSRSSAKALLHVLWGS